MQDDNQSVALNRGPVSQFQGCAKKVDPGLPVTYESLTGGGSASKLTHTAAGRTFRLRGLMPLWSVGRSHPHQCQLLCHVVLKCYILIPQKQVTLKMGLQKTGTSHSPSGFLQKSHRRPLGRAERQYPSLKAIFTLRSSFLPPLNKSPLLDSLVFFSDLRKWTGKPLAPDDLVAIDGPAPQFPELSTPKAERSPAVLQDPTLILVREEDA